MLHRKVLVGKGHMVGAVAIHKPLTIEGLFFDYASCRRRVALFATLARTLIDGPLRQQQAIEEL
jgi:hypothetical protein